MYNIEDLNVRLLSELREIADSMGVKGYKRLTKQDLIYSILDQQAVTPEKDLPKVAKPAEGEEKPKKRGRRPKRENVQETSEKKETKQNQVNDDGQLSGE